MKKRMNYTGFAADSWTVTAFLIVLLPPLGFIPLGIRALLERKLHDPKKDPILGPAIAVLLVCSMMVALFTALLWEISRFLPLLMFGPGLLWGGLMLVLRRHYREQDARERLVKTIVFRGHMTDLPKIGECLSLSPEKTADYLDSLIRRGKLKNCAVDRDSRKLQVNAPWASVRCCCPNCGGDQIIDLGVHLTCQYCDSALTLK